MTEKFESADQSRCCISIQNGGPDSTYLNRLYVVKLKFVALYNRQNGSVRGTILPLSKKVLNSSTSNSNGYRAYLRLNYDCFTVCFVVFGGFLPVRGTIVPLIASGMVAVLVEGALAAPSWPKKDLDGPLYL